MGSLRLLQIPRQAGRGVVSIEVVMIDYYYEFPEGSDVLGETVRYAFMRGYHPDDDSEARQMLHGQCYVASSRVWLENANGAVLIRANGRDVHHQINARELTWIKLQARDIEL